MSEVSEKPLILITRPMPQGAEFAVEVEAMGLRTLCEPMLEIAAENFEMPDLTGFRGLIFTSTNAVHVFAARTELRDIPVFAVGAQTAQAARATGFLSVKFASGAASDLIKMIMHKDYNRGRFLHVRGRDVAVPLSEELGANGVIVSELIAYRAEKAKGFSEAALEALQNEKVSGVVFFSKRTAKTFIELVQKNGLSRYLWHIKSLSISGAVLECVRLEPWAETYTASTPDRAGMLALLRDVYK